jgi:hypothetical protein
MRQIQGRVTSFAVQTTQGEFTFDVSAISGAAAAQPSAAVDAQPQPSADPQPRVARDANLVKNTNNPPVRSVQQSHAESSRARDLPQSDDDDDFMDPPPRRPITNKQSINTSASVNAPAKVQHSNIPIFS